FEMAWELELNATLLEELYIWIDSIPLSKPKKRIERDFSDDEEIEIRQKGEQQYSTSPRQSLLALNIVNSKKENTNTVSSRSSRYSKPICNFNNKWVSRLAYEELKQQCLQQDEEIQILLAKMRRLEHVVQLKEIRINELVSMVEDTRRTRLYTVGASKHKNK
ncbi:unnamed protein product, partial [Rotaria sp. Silwood2]